MAEPLQPSTSSSDWILDSGASHHVTSDLNNLSNFVPYEGFNELHIGNGTGMKILNIGSLSISIANTTIHLKNILHVPSFTKNLLSLSQLLLDNSLLIEFSSNSCLIKDRITSTPLLQARVSNGLYWFTLPSNQPQAFFGESTSADLWHARLGHPSTSTTLHVLQTHGLPCSSNKLSMCHDCVVAKCHRLPFTSSTSCTSFPLELIHSDVWGPSPLLSSNGYRYYVIFVDDYTRFSWIYFLHTKDEVPKVFSLFKCQIENLLNTTIKTLRTDGGTEFKPIPRLFPQIIHQTSCPYTPQQNGVAERKHRHIIELSLAIINHASIPLTFWDEIFANAVYLINRLPSTNSSKSPFHLLFNKIPNYTMLRILGCACFPLT